MNTGAHAHFEDAFERALDSPKDIAFIFYSGKSWQSAAALARQGRVLVDLGSGGGTLLHNLGQECAGRLIGVDFSMPAIKRARRICPKAAMLCADLARVPLRDGSADLALSTMVIEHLDDRAFLAEARRILAPGGHLVVTSVLKRPWAWYYLKNGRGESVLEQSHLREYGSEGEFTSVLEESGFRVVECAVSAIRFPLLDPLVKALANRPGMGFLRSYTSSRVGNAIRKAARVPVPGYYSIEAVCRKAS